MTVKFEVGQTYTIVNRGYELGQVTVTKRTDKSVWLKQENGAESRKGIKILNDIEVIQSKDFNLYSNRPTESLKTTSDCETTSEPTQDIFTESIEFTDVLNDDYSEYYDFKVGDRVVLIKAPCNVASKIIKIENGVYHVSAYGATYQDNGLNLRILTKNSAYIYNVDFESNDDYSHYDDFKTGDRVLMSSWQVGTIIGVNGGIYDIDVNGEIYQDDDCNITLFTENLAINCGIEYKPQYTPNAHDNLIAVDFTARKRV
jgi:hypothetical protein